MAYIEAAPFLPVRTVCHASRPVWGAFHAPPTHQPAKDCLRHGPRQPFDPGESQGALPRFN